MILNKINFIRIIDFSGIDNGDSKRSTPFSKAKAQALREKAAHGCAGGVRSRAGRCPISARRSRVDEKVKTAWC